MRGHDFDEYADDYDGALNRGLAVSGERKEYFARERIVWLAQALRALRIAPRTALDFGCGTGSATPYLFELLKVESVRGVDTSQRSVEVAHQKHGSSAAQFALLEAHEPAADVDLAFCNGVFHHIAPDERAEAVAYVWRSLRPGGVWAFWENNPLNLGTRWIMSRLSFDRSAIKVRAGHARELLSRGGFEVIRTDHVFIFPRFLRHLRPIERPLSGLPLGAQYQVLCRKPE
ncbi:MAG TPA: methyltransferase domain-containing protein [Polyangiaceae bacterium]|jgi:SAM-dependent methyltransferase